MSTTFDPSAAAPPTVPQPRDLPPLHRRPGETELAHRGLLLWAMLRPQHRSLRMLGRALDASQTAVAKWRDKNDWVARVGADPNHARVAGDLYASTYHTKLGGAAVEYLGADKLAVPYSPPDDDEKTAAAQATDVFVAAQKKAAAQEFYEGTKRRTKNLRTVLDATLARVAQAVVGKDEHGNDVQRIPVKVGDIGQVIRGYQVADAAEAKALAMMPDADAEGAAVKGDPIAMSQRVLLARANGQDELAAIEADAEEILLLVRTMRTHESESNVLRVVPAAAEARSAK